MATADDYGRVNLYKWPCAQQNAIGSTYLGHSSGVTNLAFCNRKGGGDAKKKPYTLLSTGGADLCVFQWKYSWDDQGTAERGIPYDDHHAFKDESEAAAVVRK